MEFKTSETYAADVETLIAAYADESYHVEKMEKMGARNISVTVDDSGDTFVIQSNREEKSDIEVPGFAKKFVKEWNSVTQTDTWNKNTKTGTMKIEVDGAPVDISGNIALVDAGSGATQNIDWKVKCGIPLVGGKLEKMTAEDIKAKAARDTVAGNEVLAAR